MKTSAWLIINNKGSVTVRKTKPDVGVKEVAIMVNIELPDALFKKPALQASITVGDTDIQQFEFNTDTVNNIQEAIEQRTGLKFSITVDKNEKEEYEIDEDLGGHAV